MDSPARPRTGPVLAAVIAGLVLGAPAGWFLAYLAALPVFLGLFFFLLMGLIIGATMYRFARSAAPLPRNTCLAMTILVASVMWFTGIVAEYTWFAADAADKASRDSRIESREQDFAFRERVEAVARERLAEKSPPGGFVGYIRWAVTDGTMDLPRVPESTTYHYQLHERRVKWVIRVVLTLVFLCFAIGSQVLGLTRDPNAPPVSEDAEPEQGPETPVGR